MNKVNEENLMLKFEKMARDQAIIALIEKRIDNNYKAVNHFVQEKTKNLLYSSSNKLTSKNI